MGLLVRDPGLFATIQDLGRTGFRDIGVTIGGAFDVEAHELANALVGNLPGAATVELTLRGGLFEAELPLAIAIAGATMPGQIERRDGRLEAISPPQSLTLRPGDRLQLGAATTGARAYLAVAGGWLTPVVLGSRSTERPIRSGDRLPATPAHTFPPVRRLADVWPARPEPFRVLDGPDAPLLRRDGLKGLKFRVGAASNRMGLRLDGPALDLELPPDRSSMPVVAGAVQATPAGLIVLGVACGTMGGYPHVAQVIGPEVPRLAQLRPGDLVRFRRVGLIEARRIDAQWVAWRERQAMRVSTAVADAFST